ncbi:hypothetical protein MMC11_000292 [Xylographa trunciseda]|nr:hypothetical protein [Xylographa trunciseda]
MADSSPPRSAPFRIGAFPGFLPLSEDLVSGSTRGQKLPALIQSRSTANLHDVRNQARRRPSFSRARTGYDGQDDEESRGDVESRRGSLEDASKKRLQRLMSVGAEVLMTPQMRSMRLIGNSNPRYQWEKYHKSPEELKKMRKPVRQYYERNNFLISQYLYIDRLLDSSLPHNLLNEYNQAPDPHIPSTINEEVSTPDDKNDPQEDHKANVAENGSSKPSKMKRTPKALYHIPDTDENTPLMGDDIHDGPKASEVEAPEDDGAESGSPIVTVAIYINLVANLVLLIGKIVVIVLTSSLSVLASLVDAALDFLSTAIVWTTTKMISQKDQHKYPVGRRRLEPIGVLVFSVIMITAFFQVALQCFQRLTSDDRSIVQLTLPAIIIMALTVVIKFGCWLWCRLIKNSSVQALAQDAMTDVVFNIFSIIFPIVGYYASLWYLDALGGLLLSFFVIINWARTSASHIRNLTGAAASADQRNVLLYLTMRFAKTINKIQGLQAYHAGDKLNVEVDIVLDGNMHLRDSHDLGESLQYVLESVPFVERAFVHQDYRSDNLPNHMEQQE